MGASRRGFDCYYCARASRTDDADEDGADEEDPYCAVLH